MAVLAGTAGFSLLCLMVTGFGLGSLGSLEANGLVGLARSSSQGMERERVANEYSSGPTYYVHKCLNQGNPRGIMRSVPRLVT